MTTTKLAGTLGCMIPSLFSSRMTPHSMTSNPRHGPHRFYNPVHKDHSRSSSPRYVVSAPLPGPPSRYDLITCIDIIDRCQPPAGAVDPVFGLSNWTICTQEENKILRDGFRSFPSGHSSCMSSNQLSWHGSMNAIVVSFAGLGFLAFYLAGKLHLFDSRGHTVSILPSDISMILT